MHNADYKTEYDVEREFIKVITTNWYKYNPMSSYEELLSNFRDKLNLLNSDKLDGQPLTDEEFRSICLYLENRTIFESSQILRGGKINVFSRGEKDIYLRLVDFDNIENNFFEVAHQITTIGTTENRYVGRFDVTLLLNGIPFVQIELKKPGVEINKAFNQVLRYKRDGNFHGLFNFIQLFVISNDVHTKYFANNDVTILKSNAFVWRDMEGELVSALVDFEKEFLFCPFLFHVVFDYMIDSASEKKLFVMRPYQIYAFDALKTACIKDEKNGYCFHSTGSGKTLTSFKFACAMAERPEIDKVFFLVDRKDLDDKTVDDFTTYTSTSSSDFTSPKNTSDLVKMIQSNKNLIVSTINKMSYALKGKNANALKPYFNKRIVFMFDECHRSQAGEMRKLIEKNFTNALYYGFTGTPIFNDEDEKIEKSRLTNLYFGNPVHIYTLKDAIGDHNVLPLCIDYINTIQLKDGSYIQPDKEVEGINYQEVLLDDRRLEIVVNDVLEHYKSKSVDFRYNAIFACQSIHLLTKYYDKFKNNQLGLKVCAIYTYDPNEDLGEDEDIDEVAAKDKLSEIINDYNVMCGGTNFSISNYAAYERNVIASFRRKEIDILLVVDKCLTGMDFVKCNTLYLDKSLKMHRLIQAVSRTIRTYDESKQCGNIVCYQTSRKDMDKALAHFNNDKDVYADVTLPPLEELIHELNECFTDCKDKRDLADSPSEEDRKEYVICFRRLMKAYTAVSNYSDFDIENTNVDMKTYYDLQSLYKDIYNDLKTSIHRESVLNDIDFEIELLDRVKVDFDYLVTLLRAFQKNQGEEKEATRKEITKFVDSVDSKSKKELLLKFVTSFMDMNIENLYEGNTSDPFDDYRKFISEEKEADVSKMVEEYDVDKEGLLNIIDEYAFSLDDAELKRQITDLFASNTELKALERINKMNDLELDIMEYFDKFDEITFI